MSQDPRSGKLNSSDPSVMRALAHPLRIEILELIDELGQATASEVAQKLEQTVANCSFHLRILAAGGFIERAEQRGREKPWKPAHQSRNMRPDESDPESIAEATELAGLYVQRESARVLRFLREAPQVLEDPKWARSVTVQTGRFWATAEELTELGAEIAALLTRFEGRQEPNNRPAGARRASFFATLNPDLTDANSDAGTGSGSGSGSSRGDGSPPEA